MKLPDGTYDKISIKKLLDDDELASKVISMLERHESHAKIIKYLNSKGYTMSSGTLSNLRRKLIEAQDTGEDIPDSDASLNSIPEDRISGFSGNAKSTPVDAIVGNVVPVYSEQQVLEKIINKGMATLDASEFVEMNVLLKALDLYARYFGVQNRGLTTQALKQYQLLMDSEVRVIKEIFERYIPKEQQAEALKEMDRRISQEVSAVGMTKEGKELLKQLNNANLDVKL